MIIRGREGGDRGKGGGKEGGEVPMVATNLRTNYIMFSEHCIISCRMSRVVARGTTYILISK